MTEIAARLARPVHRLGLGSAVALALVLVIAGAGLAARGIALRDEVLPGTQVAGVDVGGLSKEQAQARIAAELRARLARPVEISVGGRAVTAQPKKLFRLDAATSADAAFASARESVTARLAALAVPFLVKHEVAPVLDVRPAARTTLFAELSALLERPRSAHLELRGSTPVVTPGRNGEAVDEAALLEAVRDAALGGGGVVQAEGVSREAVITTTEAADGA